MFPDVIWHASWSITGDILAISGGDNKVRTAHPFFSDGNFSQSNNYYRQKWRVHTKL